MVVAENRGGDTAESGMSLKFVVYDNYIVHANRELPTNPNELCATVATRPHFHWDTIGYHSCISTRFLLDDYIKLVMYAYVISCNRIASVEFHNSALIIPLTFFKRTRFAFYTKSYLAHPFTWYANPVHLKNAGGKRVVFPSLNPVWLLCGANAG